MTVVDLDKDQLERDHAAARHYGLEVDTVLADMRDLTGASFDVVYQPYSINFTPDLQAVLGGVSRMLGPTGSYVLWPANPFASGVGTTDWTGDGYAVRGPYLDQAVYEFSDEPWVAPSLAGVPPPREYRHTLGTVIGTLAHARLFLFAPDEHGAFPGRGSRRDLAAPQGHPAALVHPLVQKRALRGGAAEGLKGRRIRW